MPNALVFSTGSTVINSSHSLKVSKMSVVANSATAVVAQINDLNGNIIGVPILVPSGAGNQVTADYVVPLIVPGGTNLAVTNATVSVSGGGGVCYLYHR